MYVASYIVGTAGIFIMMIGIVSLVCSSQVDYLPWGRLLSKTAFLVIFLGIIIFVGTGLVTLFVAQMNREDRQAEETARTTIQARLKTTEGIAVGERRYYRKNHAFTADISVLYSTTTDPELRSLLAPLVTDDHAKNYRLQLIGPRSAPATSIKITTGYFSHHFAQDNEYSLFLSAHGSGFRISKLCAAHYYCVDHAWSGLPAAGR